MKLTTREYYELFKYTQSLSCHEDVASKCRNGELQATKDEKGRWLIDVAIPKDIYEDAMEMAKKRRLADKLYYDYKTLEKDILKLASNVIPFLQSVECKR